MDSDLDLISSSSSDSGSSSSSEEDDIVIAVFGILALGVLEAEELRRQRRAVTRHYLTRPQLLPNPRAGTPWQILHLSQDDWAFVTTMGVNVETFDYILDQGFALLWNSRPIPREHTTVASEPRANVRSLDAAGALGLILQYLASSIHVNSLVLIFAVIPSTASRYLQFALSILLETLRNIPEGRIAWPTAAEFAENEQRITNRHSLLIGAVGSCDGLKLPVQVSSDTRIENATYNGWLHEHFISNVFVFNPIGKF
jgi:hypothetical protein